MYQVMIVDDEPNTLDMLAEYVQAADLGFHVVAKAMGAEDALFYFKMSSPDLLITDIKMPVTDGLSLLQQMRGAGWNGEAAIVTGHGDFGYAQQAIRLNVFEYILKPFFPEDITALLTRTRELLKREHGKTKPRDEMQHLQEAETPEADGWLPTFILQAMAFIKENYAEAITLTQVARKVSVNPVYLSSSFTKYCGENFLEYITNYRIAKSKELLAKTNLQIQEVANEVGYTDIAYFSRIFRRVTGLTPSAFRTEIRK
jgi:two-component system response regulator YesN